MPSSLSPLPCINLIGCGRVGQTLARLWQHQGVAQVTGLYSRSPASAVAAQAFIGAGKVVHELPELPAADLWLITVPDTAIAQVADRLTINATHHRSSRPVALHCSGFLSSDVLSPLARQGWLTASAHPVRSFATPEQAARHFAGTPVGLEGHAAALPLLRDVFSRIGAQCFDVGAQAKPLYHAAAVFSSNFTVVLQGIADHLWQEAGISEAMRSTLMRTLLASTLANLQDQSPARALTGPAARGDTAVVQAQTQALAQWSPAVAQVYARMSELARQLHQHGHLAD
jgi:predicted short-subunit dehydrogenase-like oxidoreductase (DUF2520 family)